MREPPKSPDGKPKDLNTVSGIIVDAAYAIHTEIGPGLLESVYCVLLADALRDAGLSVRREVAVPIRCRGKSFQEGFRADLIVADSIIVEIKSTESLSKAHAKQLLTYLRFTDLQLGLLINFGGELLKGNIERVVLGEVNDLKAIDEAEDLLSA